MGLTGTAAVTDRLRPALEALGARAFLAERSRVERLPLSMELKILCDESPHWLVFTSANGVGLFFDALKEQAIDLRRLHACRFAVIGEATAAALRRYGIRADLCPKTFTTAALAQALLDAVPAEARVWLFRSAHGNPALVRELAVKYAVRDVPLYRLSADPRTAAQAGEHLAAMDFLVFSSTSGVELYFDAHGAVPGKTVCVCIGAVTAAALCPRCQSPILTATDTSVRGILDVILSHVEKQGTSII